MTDEQFSEMAQQFAERKGIPAEIAELAWAFDDFGWHHPDCPAFSGDGGRCECGYATAERIVIEKYHDRR